MIGITGASGVLGRIISEKLNRKNILFSTLEVDIRDADAISQWLVKNDISYIIHLASKVAVSDVENNIADAYDINIAGTINLIKAINKLKKPMGFFYASSSHVYQSSLLPLKEEDTIRPINSYGLTKWMSEEILMDFKKNYPNINLCIGRIFSFHHQFQKPPFLYPSLMDRFKKEDLSKPFKLFGANSTRDFLNAEQVCDIILILINIKYDGIVNIASGKSIKIIDFVQNIAPIKLDFEYDLNEKITHLNADISLLNKIIKNNNE